jgi:ABC-type transport system involved in multi-copper enzyme maturation permease subunit
MTGILRADMIRLGRRRTLQAIVIAIPLLGATFFLLNFRSTDIQFFFDEATERQSLTADFTAQGMPLDQVTAQVDQIIADERAGYEQAAAQMEVTRATFAFPASVVTLLGSATGVYLFGMILLTATTIGDEFGWGTIRTSLLASSNRRRWLAVRLAVLVTLAAVGLALLLVLSLILPLAIVAVVGRLPPPPPVDVAALAVLVGGDLVAAIALIGFAAAATMVMRSGSLTLVVALVYVLADTAVVGLLGRLEPFRPENSFGQGNPAGPLAWALNLFPVHAIQVVLGSATQLAANVLDYSSDVGSPVLADTFLPLASVAGWAGVFVAIAMVRFNRMDIVE